MVWMTAAALAGMLTLVFVLLAVVMVNGLGVFWPKRVAEVTLTGGGKFLGVPIHSTVNPDNGQSSTQYKTANREQDPQRQDFRWIRDDAIAKTTYPAEVCVLERAENGDFYGFVKRVAGPDVAPMSAVGAAVALPHPTRGGSATATPTPGATAAPTAEASAIATLSNAVAAVRRKSAEQLAPIAAELLTLGNQLDESRDKLLRLNYQKNHGGAGVSPARSNKAGETPAPQTTLDRQIAAVEKSREQIKEQSDRLVSQQQQRKAELQRNVVIMIDAAGKETPDCLGRRRAIL